MSIFLTSFKSKTPNGQLNIVKAGKGTWWAHTPTQQSNVIKKLGLTWMLQRFMFCHNRCLHLYSSSVLFSPVTQRKDRHRTPASTQKKMWKVCLRIPFMSFAFGVLKASMFQWQCEGYLVKYCSIWFEPASEFTWTVISHAVWRNSNLLFSRIIFDNPLKDFANDSQNCKSHCIAAIWEKHYSFLLTGLLKSVCELWRGRLSHY